MGIVFVKMVSTERIVLRKIVLIIVIIMAIVMMGSVIVMKDIQGIFVNIVRKVFLRKFN